MVFSILDKDLKVSLIEVVAKKCAFLENIKVKLGLNYEVLCKDATRLEKTFEATIERAFGKPLDIVNIMEKLSNKYVFLVLGENEDISSLEKLNYKYIKLQQGFLAFKKV